MIFISRIDIPIGRMLLAATSKGLCSAEFEDDEKTEIRIRSLAERISLEITEDRNEILSETILQLEQYFKKERKDFTIPVFPFGTDFQLKVWNELMKIPFGKTITYRLQSEKMNSPLAIRAIASANGKNPLAIIIPCHRVIGSDGDLTGYAGGIHRKKWLLEHEGYLNSVQTELF